MPCQYEGRLRLERAWGCLQFRRGDRKDSVKKDFYSKLSNQRQRNLWQQVGQLGEAGFKLKDFGGRVQSGNVHAIAINWGMRAVTNAL